jgi:hypothetical protein
MAHGRLRRESPPGVVSDRKGHGPASPPPYPLRGVVHLRAVLRLSGDVSVDQVCEDAARTIEIREQAEPAMGEVPQAKPVEYTGPIAEGPIKMPDDPAGIGGSSAGRIAHPKAGRGRKAV